MKMEKKEIEKEVLILKGNGYLLAEMPGHALKAFKKAGIEIPRTAFGMCADKCFEKGLFREAAQAYATAEDEDGLIRVGHQLLMTETDEEFAEIAYREALRLRHKANNF